MLADQSFFAEAEQARQRITELKTQLSTRQSQKLNTRHTEELKFLEEQYLRELKEHDDYWKDINKAFDEKCKKEENELAALHKGEFGSTQNQLEETMNKKVIKHSTVYLDLKKRESKMKLLERYVEAQDIKNFLNGMAKREYEEFYKTNYEIIKARLETLVKKLDNERSLLKRKQSVELEFLIKQRDDSLQLLIQKYKNKKSDIMTKQTNEKYIQENTCTKRYNSNFF
jgi:hypothetical protein